MEHEQYRNAMLEPVIAFTKSRIAVDHEKLILKRAQVSKAGEVGQYLASYAFSEFKIRFFENGPARRVVDRIDDAQAQAPH